jgi:hypothetical protein
MNDLALEVVRHLNLSKDTMYRGFKLTDELFVLLDENLSHTTTGENASEPKAFIVSDSCSRSDCSVCLASCHGYFP